MWLLIIRRIHSSRQEAAHTFNELLKKALADEPQIVTKRGVESVVVLSVKEYRKLKQPKTDLVAFFRQSPLREMDLDPSRVKDPS